MHYINGREAKLGDKVLMPGDQYNPPRVGVLFHIVAGTDTCNGKLARLEPNDPYVNLKDCLHIEDAVSGVRLVK